MSLSSFRSSSFRKKGPDVWLYRWRERLPDGQVTRRVIKDRNGRGLGSEIGWHTFRHTYRTLLDETGAPIKVQQELMRHADIRTTLNVYGKAMEESKRQAHGKVVRMVLATGT